MKPNSLSAKEYRQKQKAKDPAEWKRKERLRKAAQRAKIKQDPVHYKKVLEKDRLRKSKSKAVSHEERHRGSDLAETSFGSNQAKGKSVKRASEALPQSTPKKVEVLSTLVEKLTPNSKQRIFNNVRRQMTSSTTGRPKSLTEEQNTWILEFLMQPNISYTCPGRKDQVYIGKDASGQSQYKAKHYLLWSLKELVGLINQGQTDLPDEQRCEVSYGALWRLLCPVKYILYKGDIPATSCQCDYCENLQLLLTAIAQAGVEVPLDPVDFLNKCVCDTYATDCVDNICEVCGNTGNDFLKGLLEQISTVDMIQYYRWLAGEQHPEKRLIQASGADVVATLNTMLLVFKRHFYNYVWQHREMKSMKSKVIGTSSAVIQVDFAENYKNRQQNEVQSAYFGQESFSLYTVVAWYEADGKVCSKSFCFVTDETEHSKFVAYTFNQLLIAELRILAPNLKTIHFWSDGCAGQFKSKYCFQLLTTYPLDLNVTWNYFASHHGKGPVDGVGGTIKSTVFSDVRAGKVVVNSAKEFATYADSRVISISTAFIPKEDIRRMILENVPDIPGTLYGGMLISDVLRIQPV